MIRKQLFRYILFLLLCLSAPLVATARTVNIPDANLRTMIENALGKMSGEKITRAEMKMLTRLEADRGINDLDGIQFATNLRYLHLAAHYWDREQHQWINLNEVSDISPLSGLTNLTYINLPTNSTVTDISPLAGLANLRELHFWNNNVTDLSPLSGLANLKVLDLGSNDRLSDLSPLSSLTNLEFLYLYYNSISDITALSTLTNLIVLSLEYNRGFKDITALAGLTKLEMLGISGNGITDITALADLINLRELSIADNNIADITALGNLTKLVSLRMSNNNVMDITVLADLNELRTLYLDKNNVSDISPLVNNRGLKNGGEVDIGENPLDATSINASIPTLETRGVTVFSGVLTDSANEILVPIDGDPQIYGDNVFVLPVAENLATDELPLKAYAANFYTYFDDAFDFLMIISNLDFGEDRHGYFGQHYSVRNDIQGIGLDTHFYNKQWGSAGKLQSVLHFTYYFAISNGPMLHEIMHRWANFIVPQYAPHWGFTSANGQIGGFDTTKLVSHGGSRYSAGDFTTAGYAHNIQPYSPIELYLAGFIPPREVSDLLVAENGEALLDASGDIVFINGAPVFTASSLKTYTIKDIIAEHGRRVPNYSQSQRHFRAAAILLVDENHPATQEKLQTVSENVSWFSHAGDDEFDQSYNFYEATGGRGSIIMNGLSQFQKGIGVMQTVPIVQVKASQRPPMYWIDVGTGTLHRLIGNEVENLVPSVRNATGLAVDVADGKVYWTTKTNKRKGKIHRADIDGTSVEELANVFGVPLDIAVDTDSGSLYWTDTVGRIRCKKLNAKRIRNVVRGLTNPANVALDISDGKLYWTTKTNKRRGALYRANLDGKPRVEKLADLFGAPLDIAADADGGKLYWTDTLGRIRRGNLNGKQIRNVVRNIESVENITLDVVGNKLYWTEKGSLRRANLNGKNIQDIVTGLDTPVDITLGILPARAATAAAPTTPVTPEQTLLLSNYPNPFNPETWIPYQLAEPADVRITIYDTKGALVRTLMLGHQPAGFYTDRSRAAYWDGRNTLGERVASGIYFYQLNAGTVSPMQKMVILK